MNEAKKQQRAMEKAAAAYNIPLPTQIGPSTATKRADISREAEAVLAYKDNPAAFTERNCTHCGKRFAVNRARVANCSVECVAKELYDNGILWDWSKPIETRWGLRYSGDKLTDEPLIVTQEPLDLIKQILGNVESLLHPDTVNHSDELTKVS